MFRRYCLLLGYKASFSIVPLCEVFFNLSELWAQMFSSAIPSKKSHFSCISQVRWMWGGWMHTTATLLMKPHTLWKHPMSLFQRFLFGTCIHKALSSQWNISMTLWLDFWSMALSYELDLDILPYDLQAKIKIWMSALVSDIKRSSCCSPLAEWGSTKMSNGHWPAHLIYSSISLIAPAFSVVEMCWTMSIWHFSATSFC